MSVLSAPPTESSAGNMSQTIFRGWVSLDSVFLVTGSWEPIFEDLVAFQLLMLGWVLKKLYY